MLAMAHVTAAQRERCVEAPARDDSQSVSSAVTHVKNVSGHRTMAVCVRLRTGTHVVSFPAEGPSTLQIRSS